MGNEDTKNVHEMVADLYEVFGPMTDDVIKLAKDVYDKGGEAMRIRCLEVCKKEVEFWNRQDECCEALRNKYPEMPLRALASKSCVSAIEAID